jgi:hypothetical protein
MRYHHPGLNVELGAVKESVKRSLFLFRAHPHKGRPPAAFCFNELAEWRQGLAHRHILRLHEHRTDQIRCWNIVKMYTSTIMLIPQAVVAIMPPPSGDAPLPHGRPAYSCPGPWRLERFFGLCGPVWSSSLASFPLAHLSAILIISSQ